LVFSCFNQDQALDRADFQMLHERLGYNGTREKLTAPWIDRTARRIGCGGGAGGRRFARWRVRPDYKPSRAPRRRRLIMRNPTMPAPSSALLDASGTVATSQPMTSNASRSVGVIFRV
jgi:hypothetical protein